MELLRGAVRPSSPRQHWEHLTRLVPDTQGPRTPHLHSRAAAAIFPRRALRMLRGGGAAAAGRGTGGTAPAPGVAGRRICKNFLKKGRSLMLDL